MSRIGRAPVAIPAGVEVNVADNNVVTVKGPKGTLTQQFNSNMTITVEGNVATVARPNDLKSIYAIFPDVQDMWTYWLDQNPYM